MEKKLPLKQIRIEITKKCNLKCSYCYNQKFSSEFQNELTFDELKKIIKDANKANVKTISFTGGEPFLKFDLLKKIIPLIKDNNINVGIITNGTLIDDSIAEELKNLNVNWVRFSLEGSNEKIQDDLMSRDKSFKKIIKSMDLLKQKKVPLRIRTTVSKSNLNDFEEIIKLGIKFNVEEIRFQPYFFSKNNPIDKRYLLSTEEHKKSVYKLRRLRGKYEKQIKVILDYGWFEFLFLGYDEKFPYVACSCGMTFLFVDSLGYVKTCGPMYKKMANIRSKDFNLEHFWNTCEFLSEIQNYNPGGVCSLCGKPDVCKGGCPAKIYNLYGDLNRPQPMCPLVREYSHSLNWPINGYRIKNDSNT